MEEVDGGVHVVDNYNKDIPSTVVVVEVQGARSPDFNLAAVIGGESRGNVGDPRQRRRSELLAVCNVEHASRVPPFSLRTMLSSLARRALPRAVAQKRFISTTPSRRSDALFVVRPERFWRGLGLTLLYSTGTRSTTTPRSYYCSMRHS